jgi:cell wall-associated NlpC family hydrolase
MHGTAASPMARRRVTLDGVSRSYDARVRAIRADLADVALADYYFAPHYAAPVSRQCLAASTMVRSAPDAGAGAVSELLHGEAFHMLDARSGWAWGYCGHDHYVGYVQMDALGEPGAASHVTSVPAPVFKAADFKAPVLTLLPANARVNGSIEGDYLATGEGFIHIKHLRALDTAESDWVSVAERALGRHYVWAARGGLGYDCSGLLQTAFAACGIAAPRDTDQQAQEVGAPLPDTAELRRGDMVFFPGHVGFMVDGTRLIHATADAMAVTIEPLADVIARFQDRHEQPVTGRRRI